MKSTIDGTGIRTVAHARSHSPENRFLRGVASKRVLPCTVAILLLVVLTPLTWAAQREIPEDVCTGCYFPALLTEEGVQPAATFAVRAQQEILRKKKPANPAKLELVEVVQAEKQVVAGMNYRLTLKVKLNGQTKTAKIVVYEALWQPVQRQLTSWAWQ